MKLSDKKKGVAGKMAHVKLGKEKLKNFAYRITDHKDRLLKEHGSQKGRESLNIPKGEKNMGNKLYEGKNEQQRA